MKILIGLLFLVGCGSDPKPPSCQQGLGHYYASGCSYFDGTVNPPAPISLAQMVTFCQTAAAQAPASCHDELDTWVTCNNDVPPHASTGADCDCSAQYMALLECK